MSFLVTRYSLFATLLIMLASCAVSADGQRYRGAYTYGHEVNIFCPEVNSHCYWLGPRTSQAVRARLKALYQEKKPGLYKPVCVVVDAVIDRDSPRDGFAADYDGLININAVLGACDTAAVITPGELNHRRWVLVEHDGIAVDAKFNPMVLDFGERLFVEITDGCRRFSGFAELDVDRIRFDRIEPDLSACEGGGPPSNLVSAGSAWPSLFARILCKANAGWCIFPASESRHGSCNEKIKRNGARHPGPRSDAGWLSLERDRGRFLPGRRRLPDRGQPQQFR